MPSTTTNSIMRPNTLHSVYTPEPAVCRGGHYYATSTLQDTFAALVHTFVIDLVCTNATYLESRFILAAMINFYHTALVKQVTISGQSSPILNIFRLWFWFWEQGSSKAHVPDITKEESFIDLLVACSLGVLINVLCHLTYTAPGLDRTWAMDESQMHLWNQYDVNGLSEDDRKLLCLARGQSIELISWLSTTYSTGILGMSVQKMFSTALVDICKTLCDYKWRADKKKFPCSPDFTLGRLKIQICAVLELIHSEDPSLVGPDQCDWDARKWKFPMAGGTAKSTLPACFSGMNIHKISAPQYKRKSQGQLFKMGETALDLKFAKRLEVKREIIGLCCKNIAVMLRADTEFADLT